MGLFRQKYWSGLPFPTPGYLPDLGIQLESPALAGGFFTTAPSGKPVIRYILHFQSVWAFCSDCLQAHPQNSCHQPHSFMVIDTGRISGRLAAFYLMMKKREYCVWISLSPKDPRYQDEEMSLRKSRLHTGVKTPSSKCEEGVLLFKIMIVSRVGLFIVTPSPLSLGIRSKILSDGWDCGWYWTLHIPCFFLYFCSYDKALI